MIESKQFAGGGMNQDVNENYLKPNEWKYGLNIRVSDKLDGSDGVISNVRGNTMISGPMFSGGAKCIGTYANDATQKLYSFIYDPNSTLHTITEYDCVTNTLEIVLRASFLNFQEYSLINGAGMINGDLLYFTDGFNPPRGISVSKAKTGTYYADSNSISLVKAPPMEEIIAQYRDDNTITTNNRLKKQLFQFRYLYVYEDGSRSAWSSISKLPLPISEVNPAISTNNTLNNNIEITFDIGTKYVKTIEIAAQVRTTVSTSGTNDWFLINSISRQDILDKYTIVDNKTSVKFYNDGIYNAIDVRETDLQYDFVPLKSKCLEIVNGNVLVLANNTEQYDNLTNLDVDFSIAYIPPPFNRLRIVSATGAPYPGSAYYTVTIAGVPAEGDLINFTWEDDTFTQINLSYTVTATATRDLLQTGLELGNYLVDNTKILGVNSYTLVSWAFDVDGNVVVTWFRNNTATVIDTNLWTVTNTSNYQESLSAYKTNSRYQFGIVYYDDFNRSTYVQTNDSFIVKIKSWGDASVEGKQPEISWQINHYAPAWATKYQWVRTRQLTHKNFLFWVAQAATTSSINDAYMDLNISTLNTYLSQNPDANGVISYSYTPGDRCTIHKVDNTWTSGYDVDVVNYDTTTGMLTVIPKGPILSAGTNGILLEVYTPENRSNTRDSFYYEFGEVYDVIPSGNPSYSYHAGPIQNQTGIQPATGKFVKGDIYDKTRVMIVKPGILTDNIKLEDPNFSDFYKSAVSSNGRTNVYAPQAKQLTLPTDIRYSDTYVPNTDINGLSRFYGEAYETYDRVNGSIQKIAVRDNYLITFQELKTGYIPILQSILEDQGTSDPNVAISNKLLNKIRYYVGDYGIGKHPESFARFAGTMYFADPNRGNVLKLTNGLQPISMSGMDKYFTDKLSYLNNISNSQMLGMYDPYNDEYLLALRENSGSNINDATIAWSEGVNRWTTFYSFKPDFGGYVLNNFFTYSHGIMYLHNFNEIRNYFYEADYDSSIVVVFNQTPSAVKTFLGLMEQTTTKWTADIGIRTSNSQISSLSVDDLAYKEGVYMGSFLRDIGSPGGLIEGDALKGNWIQIQLTNSRLNKDIIQSLHMRYIMSDQGIK